jgi:catechol 2,3-dioxygenase-like lactoylglutathione lyase family enzyme
MTYLEVIGQAKGDAMITGAHVIIYTTDADADRAFFRDVLNFPWVDAHGGWLIFALPPSEVAFHPAEANGRHEFYFMCDDLQATIEKLEANNVPCGPVSDQGWGILTTMTLPGGGQIGLYQPRHPLAHGQA